MGVPGKFSARVPRWVSWNFGSHVGRTIARSIAGNLGLELLLLMLQGRGPGSLYPKWARKAPLVLRAIVLGLLLAMWPVVEQPRGDGTHPQEPYPSRQYWGWSGQSACQSGWILNTL